MAQAATGVHRDLSEAGLGSGGGEWGWHHANRSRPRPVSHQMAREDDARKFELLLAVEDWMKACADVHIGIVGHRQRGERYVPRKAQGLAWIGDKLEFR